VPRPDECFLMAIKPLGDEQLAQIREKAAKLKGPQLEDCKIDTERGAASTYRDGAYA
jgi:hypothetical protein